MFFSKQTKVIRFKRFIYWSYQFDFGWCRQDQIKIILNFLNGNPHFLLHILVADLESFSKRYNKTLFN